jgi:threonine aldolase
MEALVAANDEHALAYGADPWTARAEARIRDLLGAPVETFFVWGGTGANVVSLQALLRPWDAVVCTEHAHINVDECGAPERIIGAKLLAVPSEDAKLQPDDVRAAVVDRGDEHHVQAAVVSVTQSTEHGTLYSVDELTELARVAHEHGLRVHLDGARLANAVAALDCDVRALTIDAGVDVVSFGGTKNGMMYGEAVVFLDPALGEHARFVRKQLAQLPSKLRFVAAQFEALLTDDLWIDNARNANRMAALLAAEVEGIPGVELTRRPVVNSVFARVPANAIPALQDRSFFWVWDHASAEVRWMTSFDTTAEDVTRFAAGLREVLGG